MEKERFSLVMLILLTWFGVLGCQKSSPPTLEVGSSDEVNKFLGAYEALMQPMYYRVSEAAWKSSIDVTDLHVGERIGAESVAATFWGNRYIIEEVQKHLKKKENLDPLVVRQLEAILYAAADYPGTLPDLVAKRVATEAEQAAILDSFEFCLEPKKEGCQKVVTPNEIDKVLREEKDLKTRLKYWKASKEVGKILKKGLMELRDLRNGAAREMKYSSYFGYQVSDFGMEVPEMMALLKKTIDDSRPLYEQVHCWAKRELAVRYGEPVPRRIPAHWLGNRWGQSWPGIVEGVDMKDKFKGKTAKWIVETSEKFYRSLGFPELPDSFWEKSDLYALKDSETRKKNTHASAWHLDLDHDVRSLMSVQPDWWWFGTAHHELGHVYYFLAYSRPEVPLVLREGANRAFHEAIGDLIFIAATQPKYLERIGLMKKGEKIDQKKWLLNEAMEDAPVFLPWSAGVMSEFEHDLYEKDLPVEEFNDRWWELVGKYQGIKVPVVRPKESCDACTKTHIIDDPAQYYDYGLAFLLKYQLHNYICRNILKTDPHSCDYYGNRKVGKYLKMIMEIGKTQDWRKVVQKMTGAPLGSEAMLNYFAPVYAHLKKVNEGQDCSF